MSARDEILERLWWAVPATDDADAKATAARMLDAYRDEVRHEAAEQIRTAFDDAFEASQEVLSGVDAMLAADLIDPEAN